jgi:hypothetical protein
VKRALEGGRAGNTFGILTTISDRPDLLIGANEGVDRMPEFIHESRMAMHATYEAPPLQF